MHEIEFYKDRNGKEPVLDYMRELNTSKSKDSRIKLGKIRDYIKLLSIHGTFIGKPVVKHLDGEIWELRPLKDRILFAGAYKGGFVLLHQFEKKTQKTPKREIEQAKREYEDYLERSKANE